MVQRRGHAFLVVPVLALTLFLVGCPKRPATTGAVAPAPAAMQPAMAAPVTPAPAPAPAPAPMTPAPVTAAPTAPVALPSEFALNSNLRTIYFDFDKYDIRPDDAKMLDANAAWLKSNADNLLLIEGHCDERGTNEYNLALGEKRAKAAMNYLVAQGVQASRITIISYGKERPTCTEKTEACWARNRRDMFLTKAR
jgi:peptidoglycan-associated lipoprotein